MYKEVWKHLQLLARYDQPGPLNPQTLEDLTVAMRRWNFETGGLFLSEEARVVYFDLKRAIRDLLDSAKYGQDEDLNEEDSKNLLKKASLLRARLTLDVGTRRSSPIADS